MVVELRIDATGGVQRSSFFPAVIRSRARLSYEAAAAGMRGEGAASDEGSKLAPEIRDSLGILARLTTLLSKRLFEAGSIDFHVDLASLCRHCTASLPIEPGWREGARRAVRCRRRSYR